MDITIYFKHCQYDAVPLNGFDTTFNFFTESDQDHDSVTQMHEETAITWLMANPNFRRMFLDDLFESGTKVEDFYSTKEPFTKSHLHPGDIDLLLVDPLNRKNGIAFECKRVKSISRDGHSKVNNTKQIRHGIKQANSYRELGFHQTYLMIILLDDGREMTTANTMFRSGTKEAIGRIYSIPWEATPQRCRNYLCSGQPAHW